MESNLDKEEALLPEEGQQKVTDSHESCAEKWIHRGVTCVIQVLVPLITVLHIYALSNRQNYVPDCENQFFLSLPSLASGSLLCCLLTMFVTQLTATAKDYYVASLYFTLVCAVYIVCCGGLFTASIQSADWYNTESTLCERNPYFTSLLISSMYTEFMIVCGCIGYIFAQKWNADPKALSQTIPVPILIAIFIYTSGFLLVQISAPVFLQANSFRSLFFASPSSHIDFVLDTFCIYLCLLNAQTVRDDLKTLYTIIVIESTILKWPSFFLDFTFLSISSADCTAGEQSLECLYMMPLWIGIFCKFSGLQLLGVEKLREIFYSKYMTRKNEVDEKAIPLLETGGMKFV